MASTTSNAPPVAFGWLRKRPKFTGAWNKRFFVLSAEDMCIRVFTDDSHAAALESPQPVTRKPSSLFSSSNPQQQLRGVPSQVITLSKDLLVSQPFEKQVLVSQATLNKEHAYVFKIWQQAGTRIQCLCVCASASREDAMRWKIAIEHAVAHHSRALSPAVSSSSPSIKRLAMPTFLLHDIDEEESAKWKQVDNKNGVLVEGEARFTQQFPSIRAKALVQASASEVFHKVFNSSHWDSVQHQEVLREISDQSQIVYMQFRAGSRIGPMVKIEARDAVVLRHWHQDEEDGSYVITWQSVEEYDLGQCKEGFVRTRILAMGCSIAPHSRGVSLVRMYSCADPGGSLSKMPSAMLQNWVMLTFTRMLTGIKLHCDIDSALDLVPSSISSLTVELAPTIETSNTVKLGSFRAEEWTETPQATEPYTLRSKTYLEDRIKYKCHDSKFQVVAADLYKLEAPTPHCATRSDSPLQAIRTRFPAKPIFVLQFMLPGPPFYSLAVYAVAKPGVLDNPADPFCKLWTNFIEGTDEFRSSVFKMIPRVTQGAYVVKKTVGEVPALIARKMKMNFYLNSDYVECDMDLGSSAVAGSILSVVRGYATTLTVDLGLLLEAQHVDTLPEVILCGFRIVKANMAQARKLGKDPSPEQTKANLTAYERFCRGGED